MLLLILAAFTAVANETKSFGNWEVGCDNGRACQAVSLQPEELVGEDRLTVVIVRAAATTAVVRMTFSDAGQQGRTLFVDGKPVATLSAPVGHDPVIALDARLFALMRNASDLEVRDAKGKRFGSASLKGLVATLRYIDDRQQRAGTTTALIATGPGTRVPPPPPLPVVVSAPVPATPVVKPTTAQVAALRKALNCEPESLGPKPSADAYRLDAATTLVMLSCGAGAYNVMSVAMVGHGTPPRFVPAKFDNDMSFGEPSDHPTLVNTDWDGKRRRLTTYSKGRGLGDCGSSTEHVWDGSRFRLVEQRVMGACRGSVDWIPVWRARVAR